MPVAVKVKCFNGKSYDVSLDTASETVADFQAKISEASGITPERQTILFKGKVLDEASKVSNYAFEDGVTVSVVRRVGKASATKTAAAPAAVPDTTATDATESKPISSDSNKNPDTGAAGNDTPSLEEMMRSLGVGAGAGGGAGGAPGMMPGMENLAAMFNGGLGGAAGAGGQGNMENFYRQLPQMMNGFLGPMLQEYLGDAEKQEASRESILQNPFMKQLCESDPELAKVVNDPEKWKASMAAARNMFDAQAAAAGSTDTAKDNSGNEAGGSSNTEEKPKAGTAAAAAPPGVNVAKLSESYGHALGQSLVNSGLGLEPELVVKGLRLAVAGKPFPMPLPEYERSMAQLQAIAQDYLTKTNLEHANNMFKELAKEANAVMVEKGKIAYETGNNTTNTNNNTQLTENGGDSSKKVVKEKGANVLVIVTARLLDGRHFFTCPAADDSGESVHPLTLSLDTAPPALAKGIIGMHEGETRLLYVHPSACQGMADMFGDLLPPNALLIFDLQLLDADAPEEDPQDDNNNNELASGSGKNITTTA